MNINEFHDAVLTAKQGDNIVYAKTGATPRSLMNHVYGFSEGGLVSLVQRRTAKESTELGRVVKDVGTFDYIAQRTGVKY